MSFGSARARTGLARADNSNVASRTVHIDIDVRIDGDQITGHAGVGATQPKPLLGWLGLIAAPDRLVGDPSSLDGPVPSYAAAMGSAGGQAGAGRGGDQ